MSINRWVDKQIVVYFYHRLLFGNKKEQTINTWNMGKSQSCDAVWKKPESDPVCFHYVTLQTGKTNP